MTNELSSIVLDHAGKDYGNVTALTDISLKVHSGEFFSILGPSGCGKSTLLRILAGFETPTSGDIRIGGQSMIGITPNKRPTNLVFQNYAIFPHLNVRQNISYGLRHRSLSKSQIAEKVREALVRVNLTGYENRYSEQLSGGQRQRVALARALVCEPRVLLLDEPLGALDKKLREAMQVELRQLQRSVGITFVFVTHDQEEALTLSDRIAVMSKGRIIQVGTPSDIYDSPENLDVAEFIGSMNFIPGSVIASADGLTEVESAVGRILAKTDRTFRAGEPVTVAIRPERLSHSVPAGHPHNSIAGKLASQAFYGDRKHYYIEVPGLKDLLIVSTQISAPQFQGQDNGSMVTLNWAPRECRILPGHK